MVTTYIIIGILWTLFFDWLLRTHGPDNEGLPTFKAFILHTLFWPAAIIIVVRNLKD